MSQLFIVIQGEGDPLNGHDETTGGIFTNKEDAIKFFFGPNCALRIETWNYVIDD